MVKNVNFPRFYTVENNDGSFFYWYDFVLFFEKITLFKPIQPVLMAVEMT